MFCFVFNFFIIMTLLCQNSKFGKIPRKVGYQICLSDSSVPAVVPKPIHTSEATGKPISLVGLFAEAPIGSNCVTTRRFCMTFVC